MFFWIKTLVVFSALASQWCRAEHVGSQPTTSPDTPRTPVTVNEILNHPGHPGRVTYPEDLSPSEYNTEIQWYLQATDRLPHTRSTDRRSWVRERDYRTRGQIASYLENQNQLCTQIDDFYESTGILHATVVNYQEPARFPPFRQRNYGTYSEAIAACLARGMVPADSTHSSELAAYLPCYESSVPESNSALYRRFSREDRRAFWTLPYRENGTLRYRVQGLHHVNEDGTREPQIAHYLGAGYVAKIVCVEYEEDRLPDEARRLITVYERSLRALGERVQRYPREGSAGRISHALSVGQFPPQPPAQGNEAHVPFPRQLRLESAEYEGLRLFLQSRLDERDRAIQQAIREDEEYQRRHGTIQVTPGSSDDEFNRFMGRFSEFGARWNGSPLGPVDALMWAIFFPGNLLDHAGAFANARQMLGRTPRPSFTRFTSSRTALRTGGGGGGTSALGRFADPVFGSFQARADAFSAAIGRPLTQVQMRALFRAHSYPGSYVTKVRILRSAFGADATRIAIQHGYAGTNNVLGATNTIHFDVSLSGQITIKEPRGGIQNLPGDFRLVRNIADFNFAPSLTAIRNGTATVRTNSFNWRSQYVGLPNSRNYVEYEVTVPGGGRNDDMRIIYNPANGRAFVWDHANHFIEITGARAQ